MTAQHGDGRALAARHRGESGRHRAARAGLSADQRSALRVFLAWVVFVAVAALLLALL